MICNSAYGRSLQLLYISPAVHPRRGNGSARCPWRSACATLRYVTSKREVSTRPTPAGEKVSARSARNGPSAALPGAPRRTGEQSALQVIPAFYISPTHIRVLFLSCLFNNFLLKPNLNLGATFTLQILSNLEDPMLKFVSYFRL